MKHFSEAQGLIFDMDGVLWRGGKPLPGIRSTFSLLRERQIPFVLATNNATQTFDQVRSRMENAGVEIFPNEVLTAAVGAASYLAQHVPAGSSLYVVGDVALRHALEEAYHRGIRPFCLTIDKDGADYMRTMCADMPYEVVTRVEDLPMSLVAAYPRLTA